MKIPFQPAVRFAATPERGFLNDLLAARSTTGEHVLENEKDLFERKGVSEPTPTRRSSSPLDGLGSLTVAERHNASMDAGGD